LEDREAAAAAGRSNYLNFEDDDEDEEDVAAAVARAVANVAADDQHIGEESTDALAAGASEHACAYCGIHDPAGVVLCNACNVSNTVD